MSPKSTIYNQFFLTVKVAAFFTTQEKKIKLRPRQDSNLESPDSQSDALSVGPRGLLQLIGFLMLIKLSRLIVLTLVGYCFSGDTEITTDIFEATKIACCTINNINTIQTKLLQGKHQSNTFYNDNICKVQKKGKRKE